MSVKYFKHVGKQKWIDVVSKIVENINRTPHSTHGLPPRDVNDENREEVYKKLYPKTKLSVVCRGTD